MKTFKKLFAGFALLAALLFFAAAPTFAQSGYNWRLHVYDENGDVLNSSTEVWVFAEDGESTATLYSDKQLSTVATNPVVPNSTTGKVSFWVATTTTALDIVVRNNDTDKGPCVARRASFSRTDHRIRCFRNSTIKQLVRLAGTANDVTEKDTGIDLPDNAIVYHAAFITRAGNTNQTTAAGILSSETNGDADGFCGATDTSAAGYDRCSGAFLTTAGVPKHILNTDGNSISFSFVEGASADVDLVMTYAEAFNR